jgi:tRNA(fMet)-specific endonuclease VapC
MTEAGTTTGILDTSTYISLDEIDRKDLPSEPLITTLTLAELAAGPAAASSQEERTTRQARLQVAEADFEPLVFDEHAARAFARVSASLRRAGRKKSARAIDSLIAAIALSQNLPVYTCNPGDFEHIDGLQVIPVRRRS